MDAPKRFFFADYDFNINAGDITEVDPRDSLEEAMEDAERYIHDGSRNTVCVYECHMVRAVNLRKQVKAFKVAK